MEREKKDGRKVEDNWELDYDLDRFFDEHWFWRGSYSQKHDAIDNLERQSALGTGPGYQFWDDELGRFDLVAEISRWQLEWRDQPREDFTSYSLEWDYKRLLAGTRLGCTAREPCWFPASSGSTTCSTANTACAIA